jgi:polyphosphate glucokinase
MAAFRPDDVVLGGGNSKRLKRLPKACRLGDNDNAFAGGFRLWDDPQLPGIVRPAKTRAR